MLRLVFRTLCEVVFAPFVIITLALCLVYLLTLLVVSLIAMIAFVVLVLPISPLLILYLLNNQNIIMKNDEAIDVSNDLLPNEEEII